MVVSLNKGEKSYNHTPWDCKTPSNKPFPQTTTLFQEDDKDSENSNSISLAFSYSFSLCLTNGGEIVFIG